MSVLTVVEIIRYFLFIMPFFFLLHTIRGVLRSRLALLFGDATPHIMGFSSFNPLRHTDPVGVFSISLFIAVVFVTSISVMSTIMALLILIMLLAAFGVQVTRYVPVTYENFRWYLSGNIIMMLLEPLSFFITSILLLLTLKYGGGYFSVNAGWQMVRLSQAFVFWGLLDFIPVPPFAFGMFIGRVFDEQVREWYAVLADNSLIISLLVIVLVIKTDLFLPLLDKVYPAFWWLVFSW